MRAIALMFMLLPQWATAGAAVASRTLPAGTVISAEDVTLAPDQAGGIEDITQILGQQLRVMVYEGRRIDPSALTEPTLIGRNQLVTLTYEKAALRIETEGRALSAGKVGQIIRVLNSSSRVTVSGRVAPDGSVIVQNN
ncbi:MULTISPECIES: flagellar basal body P-ring formation chaperone FlgA [Paracoccus]|uniref:Flagella basal body P-ring formation protein FlgA n=1 Tax=Paracoccus kondratievae TaxID=135740 RepID=A0AAD3RUA9_9RHOB|nr:MULTISPECIES: flagellar basal body P-ring formation chaperone FlgA [Paracoccus]GLK65398.1 flagella basal body P-ring formation protein FlgA [Paracoccus kondratievae]SMG52490.1 flagella basal body P-ring formation protein FlgA [Paracoccus sp. J56]